MGGKYGMKTKLSTYKLRVVQGYGRAESTGLSPFIIIFIISSIMYIITV